MKLKYTAGLLLLAASVSFAQANEYTVPFQHVAVKPMSKIMVNYSFAAHQQTLVCQAETNDAISSIEWTYKDVSRKIDLPVTLKDDSKFDGYYADTEGKLTITNEYGGAPGSEDIYVSCNYREMN